MFHGCNLRLARPGRDGDLLQACVEPADVDVDRLVRARGKHGRHLHVGQVIHGPVDGVGQGQAGIGEVDCCKSAGDTGTEQSRA